MAPLTVCAARKAFTEHFPVVHAAKYELEMPVVTNMAIEAHHAYLPKYHLEWHSEPMSIWNDWLLPCPPPSLSPLPPSSKTISRPCHRLSKPSLAPATVFQSAECTPLGGANPSPTASST